MKILYIGTMINIDEETKKILSESIIKAALKFYEFSTMEEKENGRHETGTELQEQVLD